MQIATIVGQARDPGGRHANERLRRQGLVPAVIYGHNEPPQTVAVSRHDLELALQRLAHVVNLKIDDDEKQYLLKDVQYDHLQKAPIHADLMRVDPNERVVVKVPLELRGEPHGIHEGGVLVQVMGEIEIECKLLEIPEIIRPRVDHLGIGDVLHVREVELPPGIRTVSLAEDIVATVQVKRGLVEEAAPLVPEAAEAAEPEVIGRTAKPEEQPEAEE